MCIPQAVLEKRQAVAAAAAQKENAMDEDGDAVPFLIDTAGQSKQTMKDLEVANGGAGVFNLDLNSIFSFRMACNFVYTHSSKIVHRKLANDEW